MKKLAVHAVILSLCLALCAGALHAQAVYGSIVGTVVDASSAVVAGAKITITDMGRAPALRGLNHNHNRDLKNLFKSAATQAGANAKKDPLGEFYENLLAKGMKPAMARLTLAERWRQSY